MILRAFFVKNAEYLLILGKNFKKWSKNQFVIKDVTNKLGKISYFAIFFFYFVGLLMMIGPITQMEDVGSLPQVVACVGRTWSTNQSRNKQSKLVRYMESSSEVTNPFLNK